MNTHNKFEQELVNSFISQIRHCALKERIPCSFVQLETGATAIGVPDAIMFLGDQMFWIEFKRLNMGDAIVTRNIASSVKGSMKMRPGQARVLKKLNAHHEKAFICAITQYMDACYISSNKLPLESGTALSVPKDCPLYDMPNNWLGLKQFILKEFAYNVVTPNIKAKTPNTTPLGANINELA